MKRKSKQRIARRPPNIGRVIALVFLAIIIIGALLLCLPVSSRDGSSCDFLTSLFTATSATCVTGLVLADTWTQWSGFGQIVILCMIEIGGLGFMSFAASVIFLFRKKIGMSEQAAIAFTVGSDDFHDAIRIQKKMLIFSIGAEVIGALILAVRFSFDYGPLAGLRLGVFHSVSAFCNAGFDILGFAAPGSSMALYGTDLTVVLTLSALIVFGGLGFLVWDEIFRFRSPKKWSVYTKLVIITSAFLLIFGAVTTYMAEWNNPLTLGNLSVPEKLTAGFFQSVTSRTAGFAGMDQGALTDAGKSICMFLMFIGGSSGSTAGGFKTVSFAVLVLFLWTRLRGRRRASIFFRNIPDKHIMNVLMLFVSMILLTFAGGIVITATSPIGFTDALYETVSAIATVGLSTGVTAMLSVPAKLMLILFMYFGRVGIMTVSLGFLQNKTSNEKIKYADTDLLIG